MVIEKKKIGLIIGNGALAIYCMEQLVSLDYELIIVRLPCSKIRITRNIDFIDARYEEIDKTFSFLKGKNVNDIMLIGYIDRPEIILSRASLGSQKILKKVFSTLRGGDGEIFSAIKNMFNDQSFRLVKAQDILPELTLSSGIYGSIPLAKEVIDEIKEGLEIFLNYAQLDVGQSLILKDGHCLGMETITGTDEMIRALVNFRKGIEKKYQKKYSDGILIKGSKPEQILDIDTPVVGPDTIKLAKKAQLKGLVIESHNVIIENKNLCIDMIESNNMFLVATNFLNKDF